jgi:lipopolysaccharide export system protein LptA
MSVKTSRPRFTIERLRTLVLVGAAVLVVAIGLILVAGQWTRRYLTKDLPHRLGVDIQQQADGVNYTQTAKGKTLFKIHAARAVQMKKEGKTLLHDVRIELYGPDGNRSDTISGSQFEYDPGSGLATATGPVEITMMRPGEKPAIAQMVPGAKRSKAPADARSNEKALAQIADNQIHVKTSDLSFKDGVATTSQRVNFTLTQGTGSSIGATFDSSEGHLTLDHAVELQVHRSNPGGGDVVVHASHAEFERNQQICTLANAQAEYAGGSARALNALIHLRDDGSVSQLDGSGGVELLTKTGGHVMAPKGTLDFDEKNHPLHGLLEGGAHLEMSQPTRQMQGSSPTAKLDFDAAGQLHEAHLEQGVQFISQQQSTAAKGLTTVHRTWKSESADITFASAPAAKNTRSTQSHIEPQTIHGVGGVVITSEAISGGVSTPSRLSADRVVAQLTDGGVLSSLTGDGQAKFEQRTATGVHQASSSDQLEVHFAPPSPGITSSKPTTSAGNGSEITSAIQTGHVVLTQEAPPLKASQPGSQSASQTSLRATANRSDYDGKTELLHLSGAPRVQDGRLDLTATDIDFSRQSGDAVARGDVRASWSGNGSDVALPGGSLMNYGSTGGGPTHAIAYEADLRQSTQEVIFRGAPPVGDKASADNQPRLWQGANSVSAPVIVLNRQKQTLDAQASGPNGPVRTVLISNSPAKRSSPGASASPTKKSKADGTSVIRVRSGDLHYSEAQRIAVFHAGSLASVTAETSGSDGAATIVSQQVEVLLLPPGAHKSSGSSSTTAPGSGIDRLTALGRVNVVWPDRRGSGEKLVYVTESGTFTLTGTSSVPPRIVDQARGTVTGNALIFHTRDDSVTVEGDGGKTTTDTQAPEKRKPLT